MKTERQIKDFLKDLEKSIKKAEVKEAKALAEYQAPNSYVYYHEQKKAKWKEAKLKVEQLKMQENLIKWVLED